MVGGGGIESKISVQLRGGFKKKKKKLMEFSIKVPDPPSQHP